MELRLWGIYEYPVRKKPRLWESSHLEITPAEGSVLGLLSPLYVEVTLGHARRGSAVLGRRDTMLPDQDL